MSLPFLKNFVGIKLTDEEMQEIPNPKLELITHVTFKTVEAGSCLSGLVIAPAYHLYHHIRGTKKCTLFRRMARYSSRGFLFGIPLGSVLALLVTRNDLPIKNVDRCFRLRHNNNQLNIDRAAAVAGLIGGVGARATSLLTYEVASLGVILGVFIGNIVNKVH